MNLTMTITLISVLFLFAIVWLTPAWFIFHVYPRREIHERLWKFLLQESSMNIAVLRNHICFDGKFHTNNLKAVAITNMVDKGKECGLIEEEDSTFIPKESVQETLHKYSVNEMLIFKTYMASAKGIFEVRSCRSFNEFHFKLCEIQRENFRMRPGTIAVRSGLFTGLVTGLIAGFAIWFITRNLSPCC